MEDILFEIEEIIERLYKIKRKLESELQKIKTELDIKTEYKRWRAEEYNIYYYIDSDFTVDFKGDVCDYEDDFKYETGNYFKTEEEAEQKLEHILIRKELKDIALRLNKGVEIDWESKEQWKYYIEYSFEYKMLKKGYWDTLKQQGTIYCLDENFKDIAIKEIGEERLINYLKES